MEKETVRLTFWRKDSSGKAESTTVYLSDSMWNRLTQIANLSELKEEIVKISEEEAAVERASLLARRNKIDAKLAPAS